MSRRVSSLGALRSSRNFASAPQAFYCRADAMREIDFDGRRFRTVRNSDAGEASSQTVFHYRQKGSVVWATYRGGADRIPAVVFVTAYDQYALRAFDVRAVDYVLKPFGRERLQKALEHARAQITREKSSDLSCQLAALITEMRPPQYRYLKRIMIKESGRLFFLRTQDVEGAAAVVPRGLHRDPP